jgi:hypothetical protein
MPTKPKKSKNIPKTPIDRSKEKQTLEAIKGSAGIISTIAKRLTVDWHTAESYIQKYPSALEAFAAEREGILDMAEATIFTAIKQGDTGSAKWILSTIGRKRGFTEKQEIGITGSDGGPVEISVIKRVIVETKN